MGVRNRLNRLSWRLAAVTWGLLAGTCGGESRGGQGVGYGVDDRESDTGEDTGEDTGGDSGGDSKEQPFDMMSVLSTDSCLPTSPVCWEEGCWAGADPGVGCVAGGVVDEAGRALGGGVAFVCFDGNCLRAPVDDKGFFSQSIDEGTPEAALYFGGFGRERLTPYCRFSSLCGGALLPCRPFVLYPAPTTGTAVPDTEMEALSRETIVEAADSARLIFAAGDALLRPLVAEAWMALTRYPLDEDLPCFIDPERPPLALYVLTPADSFVVEPGSGYVDLGLRTAALDLPNESGLAPGTEVDVYVLGGPHGADVELAEGEWRAVTVARVSSDGARIETPVGNGLSYLTWFGVSPR